MKNAILAFTKMAIYVDNQFIGPEFRFYKKSNLESK